MNIIQAYCASASDAGQLADAIRRLDRTLEPTVADKLVELIMPESDPDQLAVEALQEIAFSVHIRCAIMIKPPAPCKVCHHSECARRRDFK